MDKLNRYKGIILFLVGVAVLFFAAYSLVMPKYNQIKSNEVLIEKNEKKLSVLNKQLKIVQDKIKKIKEAILTSQKKVYAPIESDLDGDTLFFTLYNDVIEMVHANKIKIRSMENVYNPDSDKFVSFGNNAYFVSDLNLELVSNYVDLGKLVEDLYQYPYYIRINSLEVTPYAKDK